MSTDTTSSETSTGDPGRARARWSPRGSLVAMALFIIGLHLVGWGVLIGLVAPAQYEIGQAQIFGLGLGLTAYTLGMRHAFDADHIAAIDNATRKLLADGQRPVSVGFWFSLGHSTIVFVLVVLLALGVRAVAGQVADDSSVVQQVTGVVGTAVSGVFLLLIGIINLVILAGIIGVFRRMRQGRYDEPTLERQLNSRGLINRFLRQSDQSGEQARQDVSGRAALRARLRHRHRDRTAGAGRRRRRRSRFRGTRS